MARRKAKLDLTLFPFLSVLSGLIAVNVLFMIVTITTRVMTTEAEAPPPKETGEVGDPADDSSVVPDGIDKESYEQLEKQIAAVEKVLEARKAARIDSYLKLRDLKAKIQAKEIELAQLPDLSKPKTGERFGEKTPLRIIPAESPDGIVRKAVFIEVDANGFIIHPEKTRIAVDPAKRYNLPGDPKSFLVIPDALDNVFRDMAASKDNRYPIFLIHPSGAEPFQSAVLHLALKHKTLRKGWEPFNGDFLVDTSKK